MKLVLFRFRFESWSKPAKNITFLILKKQQHTHTWMSVSGQYSKSERKKKRTKPKSQLSITRVSWGNFEQHFPVSTKQTIKFQRSWSGLDSAQTGYWHQWYVVNMDTLHLILLFCWSQQLVISGDSREGNSFVDQQIKNFWHYQQKDCIVGMEILKPIFPDNIIIVIWKS